MVKTPVIGLLGGGQLGQMLCEAAAPLNIPVAVLDAEDAPAKQINRNKNHVAGSFKDASKIRALAAHSDVLTVEIEHIDTDVLEAIATNGATPGTTPVPVHPSWKTLRLVQNKYEQKEYLASKGLPVAKQVAVATGRGMRASMEQAAAAFGYPFMLKARKDSYDGRGNFKVGTAADLDAAEAEFGHVACYAEKWVPFVMELSVMVIRTEDDGAPGVTKQLLPYPVVETVHEDNICSYVYMPPRGLAGARLQQVAQKAQDVACRVVDQLWGRGVFAVELFLTADDAVVVNEIAPRPHNSGHLTIESTPYMSQFKAQLTAILDRPLPATLEPHVQSALMINVLGGATPDAHDALIEAAQSTFAPGLGVYVHMYGKAAKPSRKIGHITLTGTRLSIAELEQAATPLIRLSQAIRDERLQAPTKALRPAAAPTTDAPVVPVSSASSAPSAPSAGVAAHPLVLVTMGSDSDLPVLKAGIDVLDQFGVPWEVDITSAHRTPAKMGQVATDAAARGIKVIIAAAGGAAHLPGMLAAYTPLPVIGVPVKATHLDGMDSLLSIVQMPRGVPTATVAINNSTNAALLAIRILGAFTPSLLAKMEAYQRDMEQQVTDKAERLRSIGVDAYLMK
ncbi:phosphoribosylaminoimidazole carboxylase [Sporothrix schenckii 1099-18]|uniref:Phosphoribosylaminoimidazole carboxylase n=1 Tax=Sporothrix schenckii 1099-18 TaxID=1397361 RepID=A0A0F2MEM1_SPOSC|nr:phosphoribosylaminoimidazole carboxylase [Sporothrix schenckii 1099-18]KJR88077.1 phosphoribosylaminoimidazole carboxylase [Sporothrix schenckii 1099-18]